MVSEPTWFYYVVKWCDETRWRVKSFTRESCYRIRQCIESIGRRKELAPRPEPKSGQVWRYDGKDLLLLGKVGRDWMCVPLDYRGHDAHQVISINRRGPGVTDEDYLPRAFWWAWIDMFSATMIAENLPLYFKKLARKKKASTIKYNEIWL